MRGDMTEREERIRERAHRLWEEAGRPEGKDEKFWWEAELQIDVEDREANPGPPLRRP